MAYFHLCIPNINTLLRSGTMLGEEGREVGREWGRREKKEWRKKKEMRKQ